MPTTVSTFCQSRWKDSCAPSSAVGLTLVANGEEPVQIYTPDRTMVPAGIEAPTVAATMADAGVGFLPAGNVVYLYVYASSAYPNVDADTAAGGNLWPKSQPSPVSAVYVNTLNHAINVTVGTTTRADIDKILIYRSGPSSATPPNYSSIVGQAGQVFYVGFVENNPTAPTVTFTDNTAATQEEMEVDNFPAPQFWLCCYIDPYWYGIGNPDLTVPVTIDSTGNLTATYNAFFSGRNGQLVTFDGITTGGFDGKGTFYYKYNSLTVANVSVLADYSTIAFPGYVGTTTMRARGYAGTLYRSKSRNPFAWGYTEYQTAGDSQVRVTQTFAKNIGGYGVAITKMPQQALLKVDMERVDRGVASYLIDVSVPLESNFEQAKRLLDSRYIVTSHHSQFPSLLPNGQTGLRGFDTQNFAIVQSDSGGQSPVSNEVPETLRKAITTGDTARLFHGVFDARTELSAFWFKTAIDPENIILIDACLLYHGPSGQWSFLRDLGVSASTTIFDAYTATSLTLIGTEDGQLCQAFAEDIFHNITKPNASKITPNVIPSFALFRTITNSIDASIYGTYFELPSSPTGSDRFWFSGNFSTAPSAPAIGRLIEVPVVALNSASVTAQLFVAMTSAGYSPSFDDDVTLFVSALNGGEIGSPVAGTAPINASTLISGNFTTGSMTFQTTGAYSYLKLPFWAILADSSGTNERWARVTSIDQLALGRDTFYTDAWFDPATLEISQYPGPYLNFFPEINPGLINCEALTYFQPSETVSGQRVEMWSNRINVSPTQHWARLYSEFDDGMYLSPFQLVQTKRGDNTTPSENWTTSDKVPSGLMAQFGIRLIERGYDDFTMRSFTLIGQGG